MKRGTVSGACSGPRAQSLSVQLGAPLGRPITVAVDGRPAAYIVEENRVRIILPKAPDDDLVTFSVTQAPAER